MKHLLVLVLLLFAAPTWATTWYVGKDGHDTNNTCAEAQTITTPKLTIAAGITCMAGVGGHTVAIKSGTYAESFDQDTVGTGRINNIPSGTSSLLPTIIKADTGATVTLTCPGSASNANHQCIYLLSKSNITFDGLTFNCAPVGGNCFLTNGTANVTFTNGRLLDGTINSLVANLGSGADNTNLRVNNSEIRGTTAGPARQGFYISRCDGCLFERNWIHTNTAQGVQVHFETSTSKVTNTIFRYNLIENNGARCAFFSTVTNLEFYGNICRDNGDTGSALLGSRATVLAGTHSSSNTSKIYNNTIYANNVAAGATNACIQIDSGHTATVRNNACVDNLVAGASDNDVGALNGGVVTASNNLASTNEAVFVDAPAGRFSPRESSVLIDAGTSTGKPAGFGCVSTCDQGAFEAPVFSSAVIQDGDNSRVRVSFSVPTQAIRDGVAMTGGLFSHFAVVVAGSGATENGLILTQTTRADISIASPVTFAQVVTVAYTRFSTNTLSGNECIGGIYNCLHSEIRTFAAQAVTNNVADIPVAAIRVAHYRCLDVYSTVDAPALRGIEDIACKARPGGYFAIAVLIEGVTDDPQPITFRNYVNYNGGSYAPMTNTIDAVQPGFGSHPSSGFMDGQAVATAIITNPHGCYVDGTVVAQEQTAPSVDLTQDCSTTMIIIGRLDRSTAVGSRFQFQPRRIDGTELTYNVLPALTVVNHAAGIGY
jgi:hypothetical protein